MWPYINKFPEKLFWISVVCGFAFEELLPVCLLMILLIGLNELIVNTINILRKKYHGVNRLLDKYDINGITVVKNGKYNVINETLILIVWICSVYTFLGNHNYFTFYTYIISGGCVLARSVTAVLEFKKFSA